MEESIFSAATETSPEMEQKLESLAQASVENNPGSNAVVSGGIANIAATQSMYRRQRQVVRDYKINRNDPCPCGSGKKYKNCCLKTGTYETVHEV